MLLQSCGFPLRFATRYSSYPVSTIQRVFEDIIDRPSRSPTQTSDMSVRLDVRESDSSFVVIAELPGISAVRRNPPLLKQKIHGIFVSGFMALLHASWLCQRRLMRMGSMHALNRGCCRLCCPRDPTRKPPPEKLPSSRPDITAGFPFTER